MEVEGEEGDVEHIYFVLVLQVSSLYMSKASPNREHYAFQYDSVSLPVLLPPDSSPPTPFHFCLAGVYYRPS